MATRAVCLYTANMSRSVCCWITKSKCEYLPTGKLISVYEPDSLQMRASFCPRKLFAFLCFKLWLSSGLRLFSLTVSLHFFPTFSSLHPSFLFSALFSHMFIVSQFSEEKPHMFALMCSLLWKLIHFLMVNSSLEITLMDVPLIPTHMSNPLAQFCA